MKLTIPAFPDGGRIPDRFAFCIPDAESRIAMGPNRNPELIWSDPPPDTRAFALTVIDPDAPARPDDVNREGRVIPEDFPRSEFLHWVVTDIPAELRSIGEGIASDGITPRGKPVGPTPFGGIRGRNDYTSWFEEDAAMAGRYGGYDGPCPPWNDERPHRYIFTIYALNIPSLGLPADGDFGAREMKDALNGKVLARASRTGIYALNPRLVDRG